MNLCELLSIDETVAHNLALAYEGYSQLKIPEASRDGNHEKISQTLPTERRVSYLSRAANYWLLIDAERARECYQWAFVSAEQLLEVENINNEIISMHYASAVIRYIRLAILSRNFKLIDKHIDEFKHILRIYTAPDLLGLASILEAITNNQEHKPSARGITEEYAPLLTIYSGVEVSTLRIPLSFFTDLAKISHIYQHGEPIARFVAEWENRIGERIAERIRAAQANIYLWSRLYSSLLPLEPDILTSFIACQILMRRAPGHETSKNWEYETNENRSDKVNTFTMAFIDAASKLLE